VNLIYFLCVDDVSFIDFEYGNWNYRGFDIGNHFCEYAGFQCDYSLYPSKEQQLEWLKTYLTAYNGCIQPTSKELESIYIEVNLFALVKYSFDLMMLYG